MFFYKPGVTRCRSGHPPAGHSESAVALSKCGRERERERERNAGGREDGRVRVMIYYILLSATRLNWASIGPVH